MRTENLYISKNDCCGCEACALSCPKHIISMHSDEEGFLYPIIKDSDACINCGRCIGVCPIKTPGRACQSVLKSYGGYVLKESDLKSSASGGYATAICQQFLQNHGVVYGVKYSDDFKETLYSRAARVEELESFRTSKYTQARKGRIYADVLSDIKNGEMVLFVGLPCEVSALYHFVGKQIENLYTISLICHGPTSPKVHREFCDFLECKKHAQLSSFSLRYKLKGWKPYYVRAGFINGEKYLHQLEQTSYGIAFQYLKRPSCYSCKYKSKNKNFGLVADLTLGDYHSADHGMPHYNSWGVSQATIQSVKGEYLVNLISDKCRLESISQEIILKSNIAYHQPVPPKKGRAKFINAMNKYSLTYAAHLPQIYLPYKYRVLKKRVKKLLFPFVNFARKLFLHG